MPFSLRSAIAGSLLKKSLLGYRVSPMWYNFTTPTWLWVHRATEKLIGSYSVTEFEEFMRPILVPQESITDIEDVGWEASNNYFQVWLRNQYLMRKYGSTETYFKAEKELEDQSHLPSIRKLVDIFKLKQWKYVEPNCKDTHEKAMKDHILQKAGNGKTNTLNFEELLEIAGCSVMGCNEYNWFCEENQIFEFFTKDYIDKFGKYLRERVYDIASKKNTDSITILEVGAGSGVLGHFLQNDSPLMKLAPGVNVEYVATDSGIAKLHVNSNFQVLKANYSAALMNFQPDIVICSWMPMNEDWSVFFRQFRSVYEYILIGEFDDGCCGHNWFTWGNIADIPSDKNIIPSHLHRYLDPIAPYVVDNFEKIYLNDLSYLQYSKYDTHYSRGNSATFSFRKKL